MSLSAGRAGWNTTASLLCPLLTVVAVVGGGIMKLMQARRLLAIGVLAVSTAACSGGVSSASLGEICGVTALAGGPGSAVGVKNPALLHECPSGPHEVSHRFTLVASSGQAYTPYTYDNSDRWTASLPAGTYRAVNIVGCGTSVAEGPYVVAAGKILRGVVVWWGCDYS